MKARFRSARKSRFLLLLLSSMSLVTACSTLSRAPAPLGAGTSAAPVGFPPTVRFLGIDPVSFDRHASTVMQAVQDAAHGGRVNVLALSGGGAGGAYGAGALVGMTRSGDRPVFHIVTGVSVRALLARLHSSDPDLGAVARVGGEAARVCSAMCSWRPQAFLACFRP